MMHAGDAMMTSCVPPSTSTTTCSPRPRYWQRRRPARLAAFWRTRCVPCSGVPMSNRRTASLGCRRTAQEVCSLASTSTTRTLSRSCWATMLLLDVNVCVYAIREDSVDHESYRSWITDALTGNQPVGMSELVLSGVVRLLTNHRIFRQPSSTVQALDACRALRSAPAAVTLRPGPRHWAIFESLCAAVDARANTVPDAYHAALAIENGATWITTDRSFAQFPGLSWRPPLA